ncbi:hypothetical protein EPUS_00449 [Endocarpon pusillum Z07020]|uniref:Uncharacterized protein n=1 Tax=Endocarpon pusillum (strain Z07020 / HMAS-L-300199) TaxID=1263415 RepID=U1GEV3_ENDPU|nr:uncharacterized protein EPUS_00449 [Endocarpon pusillum Z07020]ERF70261.1 hypothetical protein EPUS_00449 [Endocarpon pusillum Z07020]
MLTPQQARRLTRLLHLLHVPSKSATNRFDSSGVPNSLSIAPPTFTPHISSTQNCTHSKNAMQHPAYSDDDLERPLRAGGDGADVLENGAEGDAEGEGEDAH